ncbi:TPM domain-containing protein [Winogradskyella bathintestinalis]|uniref:TPM domain-containing protein n=1 Tax=Winogradskyella bathintestinalis TaxID=3035208 RepID=A0ABT7ZYI0_9FLAO|nr:TPM domain-containing protein [Winogradskyella bathintestinalis]MDN3494075.1 TPM domain-containing protein [Winogradskyella bathintestinalis]
MYPTKNNIFQFLILLMLASPFIGWAQYDIPEKPEAQTSIYDGINLLSTTQKNSLEQKLIRYSDSTSTQIVLATISSTKGEYINYLGAQWAEEWGIGQANKDNGIFILLARDDRKIGISTGKGIEHLLTDALSKRIINNDIIPYFKQDDYYGGLDRATDAIFEVLNGEYKRTRQTEGQFPFEVLFFLFIIFIIFIIVISKSRGGGGGNRGNRSGSRSLLEAIILSNMGRGSYSRGSSGGFGGFGGSSGGGSFGGGGFGGGFGGGSFGGGGASGGW